MKQHITPKQLNELSEKGKEKLRKWWKPEFGDIYYTEGILGGEFLVRDIDEYKKGEFGRKKDLVFIESDNCDQDGAYDRHDKEEVLPLLSIGQMIEFLSDSKSGVGCIPDTAGISIEIDKQQCKEWYWFVYLAKFKGSFVQKQLSDSLWEAVKKVLEGQT